MGADSRAHTAQAALERRGALRAKVKDLSGDMARSTVSPEKQTLFDTLFAVDAICRYITGFFKKNIVLSKRGPDRSRIWTSRHVTAAPFNGNRQSLSMNRPPVRINVSILI
jgi:hypothetical protein